MLGVAMVVAIGINRSADAGLAAEPGVANEFAHILDESERAAATFVEIGKVLRHPRCLNCHPSGPRPTQADDGRPHEPKVVRGPAGLGLPGMTCSTCHGPENAQIAEDWSMPGNPAWHLAPAEMGWQGKTLAEICEQVKDPARNGGKTLDEIVEHMAADELVGWGWEPGAGREPAPGTQAELGAHTRAWVDAGAGCPAPDQEG
jgi:hypothetical protein